MKHVGRILLSILLSVSAVLMMGCGREVSLNTSAIPDAAGYNVVSTNAYPGVVMVIGPMGRGMCTGAIVSPYAVMTATHCVLEAGTYTVRARGREFRTSRREKNGTGTVDDSQDLALLIFDEAITMNSDDIYPLATSVAAGDAVTIVGYGCNNIELRIGSGIMREGTNRIAEKDAEFLRLLTPRQTSRGIIGDANQAGTCFGDSGGPMFRSRNGRLEIVGVTHAGGTYGNYYVSEFVNVADRQVNRGFLAWADNTYSLNISGI